jgi:hypothetical protein
VGEKGPLLNSGDSLRLINTGASIMLIALFVQIAKLFLIFSVGICAVIAAMLLLYLPFCIADCLRQRWGMGRWSSLKPSASDDVAPSVDVAPPLADYRSALSR